jgi:hypothetical protein
VEALGVEPALDVVEDRTAKQLARRHALVETSSRLMVAMKLSATALKSQHSPLRPIESATPWRSANRAKSRDVYWQPLSP